MLPRVFFIQNTGLNQKNPISLATQVRLVNFYKAGFNKIFDYNLILSKSVEVPGDIRKLGKTFYELPGTMYGVWSNILFSIKTLIILFREHREFPIDILHCSYPNSSLLPSVVFKLFISRKTKILYNVRSPWIEMIFARKHIRTRFDNLLKWLLHIEEFFLVRFVDLLLTNTSGIDQYYSQKYRLKNIRREYIPGPIDLNLFKPQQFDLHELLQITKENIIIGYIGTIDPSRRIDQFIEYFYRTLDQIPNMVLLFIGWGPDIPRLQDIIEKLAIKDKVFFLPPVPYKEVPKYISGFTLGLCHLPDEFVYRHSYPQKIQEYLACKVPVLASNIKAHKDMAHDLQGIYIYNDSNDLTKILSEPIPPVTENLESRSIEETVKYFKTIYQAWFNEKNSQ